VDVGPTLSGERVPKEPINPDSLFSSLTSGFSQGVVASGRRTLYVSGQVAWDSERQLVGGDDLEAQATRAFENLATILKAAGGSLAHVVSLRLYIVDYRPEKAAVISSILKSHFASGVKPAATWIGVQTLANPGFLIEVEATAVLD
jgi:enamine deaminase RidA (YjgF/YER057c/UK114 family)